MSATAPTTLTTAATPAATPATLPAPLRLRSMTWAADGVLLLEWVHPHGAALPAFEAGAHIDLALADGLSRSYSLCNPPGETQRYCVAVGLDRHSRGGSRHVHEQLRPGALVTVSAPRNHFRLDESAPRFALLAGGIGVTPILAMARRLAALGKPVELFYAVRSRAAAAFADELAALVPALTLHIDTEAGGPPDLAAWLARLPRDTGAYCCGPAAMLDGFISACQRLGLADAHVERFAAPASTGEATAGCSLTLQRSGRSIVVTAGTSILDALLAAGIDHPYSCKEGLCGTCETRVIAGEIDHRDSVLSPAEQQAGDVMMVCVSGCKGARLVLDL